MKLLYATSAVYPSKLANRLQILAMARAFSEILGDSFYLGGRALEDAKSGSRTIELPGSGRSPFLAWRYTGLIRRYGFTHVYCREERLLTFLIICARLTGLRTVFFYEAHWVLNDSFFRFSVKHAKGIVAITKGIRDDLVRNGIPEGKICVASDGVDLAPYENLPSKEDARREYGFLPEERVIAYTGSFSRYYDWKGVDTLLAAAKDAAKDWLFVLAGGEPEEVEELRKRYAGQPIRFLGALPHAEIPSFTRAADVLILPNKAGDALSEKYTSPLKLFEYMASGTPMVASDLPSLREVLSEKEATFFPPGDAEALRNGISTVLSNPEANSRAVSAREKVTDYTWERRAEKIISFLRA